MKYGNTVTQYDGYSFASKLEAAVYQYLKLRERAGEIKILQCQAHVYLTEARIECIPDFKVLRLETNEELFVEAKGFESPRWPVIKKLWKVYGPGVLEIWKGTYSKPNLVETIIPKNLNKTR